MPGQRYFILIMEDAFIHYLFPSALFINDKNYEVTTILGSCVSVCLYDTEMRMGGINHFMLPQWNGNDVPSLKYGDISINKLIDIMISKGCTKENINAKIFGGWEKNAGDKSINNIGLRNSQVALEILESSKIRIIASSIGGEWGRKLKFYTRTGEVYMKMIKNKNLR